MKTVSYEHFCRIGCCATASGGGGLKKKYYNNLKAASFGVLFFYTRKNKLSPVFLESPEQLKDHLGFGLWVQL